MLRVAKHIGGLRYVPNVAAVGGIRRGVPTAITPLLGADILVDGDMELAGTTNWANYNTPVSVAKDAVMVHGGSQSLAIVADAQFDGAVQTVGVMANTWYRLEGWLRPGPEGKGSTLVWDLRGLALDVGFQRIGAWLYVVGSTVETSTTDRTVRVYSRDVGAGTIYADDLSLKPLIWSSCLAEMWNVGGTRGTFTAAVTSAGSFCSAFAGIACGVDNPAAPTYGIFAGTAGGQIIFAKLAAGTWTVLRADGIAHVAGALIEIRWMGGNDYEYWYNGAKRGTTQVIDTTGYGGYVCAWNTYSGNIISEVTSSI